MSEVNNGFDAMIEACEIFKNYATENRYAPFNCSHDELTVCAGIDPEHVLEEDIARLEELGFDTADDHFYSFRFGSC